ncbi:MAG: prepilin-type N-terminal cleavage/methylation domain-containing protein, partial [Deltaproteobacteria bacterium]|nr:prepilin-type N-terminal cleavage/methylation domain-containing protein [Deltaproteobacteria bacterium]
MKKIMNESGFTLIELLLVVVVMGLMLAVIVPRGQRATTDVKYSIVRQNASELASFANGWVEQEMLAQDDTQISRSTSTRGDYLTSLTSSSQNGDTKGTPGLVYIADGSGGGSGRSNWNNRAGVAIPVGVPGRKINNTDAINPETT